MKNLIVTLVLLGFSPFTLAACGAIGEQLDKILSFSNSSQLQDATFADCKLWASDPSKTIVALATSQGVGSGQYDLTLWVVKSQTGEVLNQLSQKNAFTTLGALEMKGIVVDPSLYALSASAPAFGVRTQFINSPTAPALSQERFALYVVQAQALKPVLNRLLVANQVLSRELTVANTTHHGLADLVLKEKALNAGRALNSSKQYSLQFDGAAYAVQDKSLLAD